MTTFHQFLALDFPPLVTAVCSALACTLLGNFLVLRKISLMGDAISHSVLPGIVGAFLLTSQRDSLTIFLGAAAAGLLSALCIEAAGKLGRLESGAAMGVVFSLFFAGGILLMERAAARHVDLDANCLLYGQLENIFWYPPDTVQQLFSWETFSALPPQVLTSFAVFIICALFVLLFYKELKISSFDPALATSLGFNAGALHYLLMVFVAGAVVASFEAVGSILVIAMLICPAAAARLCTDRFIVQINLSLLFGLAATTGGYFFGAFGPPLIGRNEAVSTAGAIAVAAGLLLAAAAVFAPRYGWLGRKIRQRNLVRQMALEDVLGIMYRREELNGIETTAPSAEIGEALGKRGTAELGLRAALSEGLLTLTAGGVALSAAGRERARSVVRTHRLWESYLVERLGLQVDHVHDTAMELEHFTAPNLAEKLAKRVPNQEFDPHGKLIPSDSAEEEPE